MRELTIFYCGLLITFAERHTNHHFSPFHQHMARHSYRTYLLHMTVVILVQFGLLQWISLPAIAVLLVGLVLSILGTHVASLAVGRIQSTAANLLKQKPSPEHLQPEAGPAT